MCIYLKVHWKKGWISCAYYYIRLHNSHTSVATVGNQQLPLVWNARRRRNNDENVNKSLFFFSFPLWPFPPNEHLPTNILLTTNTNKLESVTNYNSICTYLYIHTFYTTITNLTGSGREGEKRTFFSSYFCINIK